MSDQAGLDFLVDRSDWKQHRVVEAPVPPLGDGEVLFRVDRFALTANNISYALAGDLLGYWKFFPAADGWGRIPAMGFADVVESKHPQVKVGTRCFGFYPMSRYLKIEPSSVGAGGISDGAAHRAGLAAAYNQYTPTESDNLYRPQDEDALMLMRGLFFTSFLADDFVADRAFGEDAVLISSASSKTSIALGHQVSTSGRARAVGLTSQRNADFVRGLGCYDEVVTYDQVREIDAARPTVYVDMAGDKGVLRAVHEHLGDSLKHSCAIGATHWEQSAGDDSDLPGPKPEFFFAPAQIAKRSEDWGPAELQRKLGEAWSGSRRFSEGWLEVQRGYGAEALARAYDDTVAGRSEPQRGHVLSLWDAE